MSVLRTAVIVLPSAIATAVVAPEVVVFEGMVGGWEVERSAIAEIGMLC